MVDHDDIDEHFPRFHSQAHLIAEGGEEARQARFCWGLSKPAAELRFIRHPTEVEIEVSVKPGFVDHGRIEDHKSKEVGKCGD
jgi:hypothetical protein